jgi:hypothetical protein
MRSQFTIRGLLIATACVAPLAMMLSLGGMGQAFLIGCLVALGVMVVIFAIYAITYRLFHALALIPSFGRPNQPRAEAPLSNGVNES